MKIAFGKWSLSPLVAVLALAAAMVLPVKPAIAESPALDRPAVEKIIRDYLLENPELMLEVQDALEAKQDALRAAQQSRTLSEKREQIYNSANQMVIGNPDAAITVVEFFDYNCGFCKRALDDMNRILAENDDVKFVLKEFPVLGEASLDAHRVSLAVSRLKPEIYPEFHRQLLGAEGSKDGQRAFDLAVSLGADREALSEEIGKPAISDAIREVYELADGLGITGTPSYVVGEEVVFGAVGYGRLSPKLANLGECGKTVC